MAEFVASVHQGRIIFTRSNSEEFVIDMAPSEVEKATHVVGLALSLIELDSVPDHIKNSPFVVRFFSNQRFALERADKFGSLPFRTREGDELIQVLNMGLAMCLNEQTHGRAIPKGMGVTPNLVSDESF